jgi:tripartite-type tricarboxylate transporter receptor subunit TctC
VLNDLIPIAELAYEPLMICVKNALPVRKYAGTDRLA